MGNTLCSACENRNINDGEKIFARRMTTDYKEKVSHVKRNVVKEHFENVTVYLNDEEEKDTSKHFLASYRPIKNLCQDHMIDPQVKQIFQNQGEDLTNNLFKKYKDRFFTSKTLIPLCINKEFINEFMRNSLQDINFKEDFFSLELNENKFVNIVGFKKKMYLFDETDLKKPKLFIKNIGIQSKKGTVGVYIEKSGKLFAGRFSDDGTLNGDGIYIDKKGNYIFGTFRNSDLVYGTVYGLDGSKYEGRLMGLKKHGVEQTEHFPNYDFIGDFVNGKKIKGKYIPRNNSLAKSISIDEESMSRMKESLKTRKLEYKVTYELEKDNIQSTYIGAIQNKKLHDENAYIQFNKGSDYPSFRGKVIGNSKTGEGSYNWNEKDSYAGLFFKDQFHSKAQDIEENYNADRLLNPDKLLRPGKLRVYAKDFEIYCDKGELMSFKEINLNSKE